MKKLASILCALALVACGGGGGGSTPTPTPVTNIAPVADAGSNLTLPVPSTVTLDASKSSDANGDPLTYSWTMVGKPTSSTATLAGTKGVLTNFNIDVAGIYIVSLVVNDGKIDSSPSLVTITTLGLNAAPVANAGLAQNVVTGTTVSLDGSGSLDTNGDSLTYLWNITAKPVGSSAVLSSTTVVKPTFVADLAGTYTFGLVVNDGRSTSPTSTVNVQVTSATPPPVAYAGDIQDVGLGSLVTLNGSNSSSTGGGQLTYVWTLISKPAGSTAVLSSPTTVSPQFTVDIAGTYVASLAVNDGKSSSAAANVYVTSNVNIKVAAGRWHTLVTKPDGSLWGWGYNLYGQVGDGTTTRNVLLPEEISGKYNEISAGEFHSLAIKSDNSLWSWGLNDRGQLGNGTSSYGISQIGTGYSAISANGLHSIALKSDGSLWSWGVSSQVGDGSTIERRSPVQIGVDFKAISAGQWQAYAIKNDGSLWAWGENFSGQLGDGTSTTSLVPRLIGNSFKSVHSGGVHTVALKSDGSLWAWGMNDYGQLGDGTLISSLVPKQVGVGYIAAVAGFNHTVALKSDGSLWAWGGNNHGESGGGTFSNSQAPKQIGTGYISVAAGYWQSFAVKNDGSLWAWGDNIEYELGDGSANASAAPKQIFLNPLSSDTTSPSVPTGLTATPAGDGKTQVNLYWNASTDNVAVTAYKVYRNGVLVSSPAITSFSDSGLTSTTSYTYGVAACDRAGNCSSQVTTTIGTL